MDSLDFLMERIFQTTPTEWLPGVQLKYSVPLVQYTQKVVKAGGCLVVIAQWWSTGGSSQVSWV